MFGAILSLRCWLFLLVLASAAPLLAQSPDPAAAVTWNFTRLDEIGGHKTTLAGSPRLVDTVDGKAIEFDGIGDGVFVEFSPLTGLKQFTAEVIFRPYAGGAKEQRFLHFQEEGSDNRLLFEIRIVEDRWFLDTFIKSGGGNHTLFAEKSTHEIGPWYHAAVVVDGATMRHYVNGKEELSTPIKYEPQDNGRTSIGVRINKVSWFKGAVWQVRITPAVLSPRDFLRP
jgi:hypothetical protein